MSKNLYPDIEAFAFKKSFLLATLLLVLGIYNGSFAQCNVEPETSPLPVNPSLCANGSVSLGPGAYYNLTVASNTYYNWSFSNGGNSCVDGFCAVPQNGGAASFTSDQTDWFSGSTTTLQISAGSNGCFFGTSAVMTYRYSTPTITAASATPNPICTGSTLDLTSTSAYAATLTWAGPGFSSTGNNTTLTDIQTSNAGNFTFTATNGTCIVSSSPIAVVVNNTPTVTATPSTASICSGTAPSIALTSTVSGTTYAWSVAEGSGITGGSAGTGTPIAQTLSNSSNSTAGTATYTIKGTANSCTAEATAVITVNPIPTVTATPATAPVCSGSAPSIALTSSATGTVYTWTVSEGSGISGGSNCTSACGSTIAQTLSNSSNSTAGTATYTITGTANTCTATATAVVTVNPKPAITATPATATVCSGSAPNIALTSTASGTTYAWSVVEGSGITGGSAGSGTPIAQTLSNSSNSTAGTATYTITGTANSCTATATASITVNPVPAITATPATVSICSGSAPSIVLTSSAGGTTYAWSVAEGSGITGGSTGSGTPIAQTLSNSSNSTAGTATYTITGTANSCTATATAVVTVDPVPAITATPATVSICSGSAPSIALTSTASGTTYTWSVAEAAGISGGSGGSGTPVAQTLSNSSNSTAGTATYTITGTASSCSATATAVITVNPAPAITATPATVSICSGSAPGIALTSSTGGTTYAWSVVEGSGITGGSAGTGTPIAQTLSNSSNSTAGTATYTITGTAIGCTGTATAVVTVNPIPTVTATPATTSVCSGSAPSIALTSSATGTAYTWTVTEGSGISGGSNCTSTCGSTIGQTLSNSSNSTAGTATYTITGTANICTATATATITVNPIPVVTATPVVTAVCSGSAPSIALTSTASGTTYAWSVVEGSGITGGSAGSGTPIAQTLSNSSNSTAGTATYTITGTANTCTATATASITVNPKPAITATPATVSICSGSAPSIALTSSAGGTTYTWSVAEGSGITGGSTGSGTPIAQALSNSSNSTAGTATYTITGTANTCTATATAVVTVDPIPAITATPATVSICSGSAPSIALTSTASGTTYTWSVAEAAGISGGSGGSGTPVAQTLSNSSNSTAGTATYTITGTASSCSATATAVITVNPAPAITATPATVSICSGSAPGIALTSSTGGTTYAWSVVEGSGITGGSAGTGTPIAQTLSNSSNSTSGTATYTITGTAIGCTGTATAVVTVNPTPAVTATPATAPVCSGSAPSIALTSSATGTAYTWTVSEGSGISGGSNCTSGCGSTIAQALSNSNSTAATATYTVTGTANSCTATATAVITVNPLPTGSISGTTSICTGSSATLTFNLGSVGPFDVIYTDGTNNYTLNGINNGHTVVVSPTASSTTYQLTSITDNNGCTRGSNFLGGATIAVTPLPVISSVSVSPVLCYGTSTGSITVTATSGSPGYTYSIDGGAFQSSNVFSGLPQGTNYVLEVQDSHGCTSFYASNPVTVTQPTVLTQTDTSIKASCANVFDGSITVTASGGVTPYNYSLNGGPSQAGNAFDNLGAGNYVVQVTDFNGCTDTAHVIITNSYVVSDSLLSQTNVSCFGGNDGALTVQLSGGVPSYSYSDNGSTFQSSPTFTGLTASNYVITLRDSRGCTDFITVGITQPGVLDVLIDSVQNVLCSGASQGAIYITVSGGTTPYGYTWSNGATTQNITNLFAGTYNVTVLDAHGCNSSSGATITQPLPLFLNVATVHNLNCYNDSSGYIYVSVNGGTPPYTYSWSNGATTQDISGLRQGTYDLTVLDANHCEVTISQAVSQPTQLTSAITPTNVTCNGAANGSIAFSVSGGTSPYAYLWSDGATTQDISNLSGGTYSVVVNDANGCTLTNSANVAEPAAIVLTISGTPVGCNGAASGTISTTVSGGTNPIGYLWSNSATTSGLTNVGAGTYSVVITDASSCTASASITLSQPTALVLNGTVTNVSCAGGDNGSVDITVNGGNFPYAYSWSNTATTQNINDLSANTYIVTATDANHCTISTSFNVTAPAPITSSIVGTNVTCHGEANGTATLTVGGGSSPYSYSWSNFQITKNLSGLSGGTYYVTITDANGCTRRDSVIITEPAAIVLTISGTNVSCNNGSNGSVSTTVTGGTGNISYAWSNSATTSGLTNVGAGTYSVVITDANSCTASASITLSQPTALVLNGTVTNVSCAGGDNGSVDITVNGGNFPYAYSWSNTATTQNINDLSANTYIVTATDANHCTISTSFNVTAPAPITSSIVGTNVTCHGEANGTATLTVGGGSSPYSYSWSNFQITKNLSGLSGGTYYVTITDANGCTRRDSVIITEPAAIVLTISGTNVSCNNGSNGSVSTTVTGGTGNISYAWSNSATTSGLTNVGAGTYSVVITDANSCTASASITLSQPTALVLNGTVTNVSCAGGDNGSVDITVNGGNFPYAYSWSNTATTQNINDLSANTYIVTATDANHCTISTSFNVTAPAPITSSIVGTNVTCHGEANGTATLTVGGGSSPYSYSWSNFQITKNLSGLSGGTYYVTITDANGCTRRDSVIITEPAAIVLTISGTNVSCNNGSNGSVSTTVTGGTGNISYAWSNSATTSGLTNVGAGTYSVVITDANSCTASASITLSQPTALVLNGTVTNVSCAGGDNGSVDITVNGGNFPYAYSWSNTATTQNINDLSANTYIVTATDANHCTISTSFNVTAPAPITSSIVGTNVTCHGEANGTATLTVGGGSSPYSYSWSNFQITKNLSGLSGGTYYVTITDANGCTRRDSVIITEPAAIVLTISSTNVSCNGGNNGTITTSVTGGTGNIAYAWSNGATTANLTNLVAGVYHVTPTDASGCSVTDSATITQPAALIINGSVSSVACYGGNDGSIQITVNGGVLPYSYAWSSGATTQNVSALTGGAAYTVTVTDANLCTITASYTVTSPSALITGISGTNVNCFGENNGTATVTESGGTPPYSNLWSNFQAGTTISNLSGGLYYVLVTDANGCSSKDSVTITEPTQIVITSTVTQITCAGANNGAINLTVTGGVPAYSYTWSPSLPGTPNQSGLGGGNYSVTVEDQNSCTVSAEVGLPNPLAIGVNFVVTNPKCFGNSDGVINLITTGGQPPYSFVWSPGGNTTSQVTNASVGTYDVTVTDSRGCSKVDSAVVSTPNQLYTSGVIKNVSCAGRADGQINVTVYGGTPPYNFAWSSGPNTQDLYHLAGGNYYVSVTDANGCQVISLYIVQEPVALTLGLSATNVSCFGGSNGTVTSQPGGGTKPYNFFWSGAASNDAALTNVSAGNYGLQLTDSNGCQAFDSIVVTQPTPISITGISNNAVCFNTATGSVIASTSGGTPGYDYSWSNGGVNSSISAISAGVYTVTVTDAANCTSTAGFTVQQASQINIAIGTYDPICYGGNTGSLSSLVNGGTEPYHYAWSAGAADTTVSIDHLVAGGYTVTVTDNVGCSITAAATLNQPALIAVTPDITGGKCSNTPSGIVIVNTTGGTPPFNYSLNGIGQSSDTFQHILPGRYELEATDVNGCQGTDTFTIVPTNMLSVSLSVTDQVIVTGMQTQLSAAATSSSPITQYIWDPIAIDSVDVFDYDCTDTNNCPAPYVKPPFTTVFTVTAVNADSCEASDTITVYVHNNQGLQFIPNSFTPNGDGLNDRFTFAILGANTIEVFVFDRWGQKVYYDPAQPNGISNSYGWDGTNSGKPAPVDTYVYQLNVTYFDNSVKQITGTVTLMR